MLRRWSREKGLVVEKRTPDRWAHTTLKSRRRVKKTTYSHCSSADEAMLPSLDDKDADGLWRSRVVVSIGIWLPRCLLGSLRIRRGWKFGAPKERWDQEDSIKNHGFSIT